MIIIICNILFIGQARKEITDVVSKIYIQYNITLLKFYTKRFQAKNKCENLVE